MRIQNQKEQGDERQRVRCVGIKFFEWTDSTISYEFKKSGGQTASFSFFCIFSSFKMDKEDQLSTVNF